MKKTDKSDNKKVDANITSKLTRRATNTVKTSLKSKQTKTSIDKSAKTTSGRIEPEAPKKQFPEKVPFWTRMRIGGKHTSLVIDKEKVVNKKTKKEEPGFVYREATHKEKKDREKIFPNPDRTDPDPMYLKRPEKKPQRLFEPHNKVLDMPEHLKKRYEKNNTK